MVEETMTEKCPVCERGTAHKIQTEEWFPWKGHTFFVKYDYWECERCSVGYIDVGADDPFSQAKAKYKEMYEADTAIDGNDTKKEATG